MKNIRTADITFYCLTLIVSIFYFINIRSVPFHPDESTQIFMSSDVELFFHSPSELAWNEETTDPIRQSYRLLDSPITRLMIGIGRNITGLKALEANWDWSKSWEENESIGALPNNHLLYWSRFFVCWIFPLSVILLYETGKQIKDRTTGWVSAILFLINPLVLLHTRRAMAESALVFSVILCLYYFVKIPKKPWLLVIPVTIAFNCKQSAAGLIIFALLIIVITMQKKKLKFIFPSMILFMLFFCLITFLLNPFLWSNPFASLFEAIHTRMNLISAQSIMFNDPDSLYYLNTFSKKVISMFGHLFIASLKYQETANYLPYLNSSISEYNGFVWNNYLFFKIQRYIILIFSSIGILYNIMISIRNHVFNNKVFRVLGSFLIFSLFFLFLLPFSYQRYYLPLIPFLTLLCGLGIAEAQSQVVNAIKNRSQIIRRGIIFNQNHE